jgi:hypothetical protein
LQEPSESEDDNASDAEQENANLKVTGNNDFNVKPMFVYVLLFRRHVVSDTSDDGSSEAETPVVETKGVYVDQEKANKRLCLLVTEFYSGIKTCQTIIPEKALWPEPRALGELERYRSLTGEYKFVVADKSGRFVDYWAVQRKKLQ